ncbi:MAG: BrnT family toxin [Candidatus Omnitrophica bacterium]|nr:BrnT family toxin [Candidatus Omnitrophota bacterium]
MDKLYEWDQAKNQKLILERGISFEAVVTALGEGSILKIVPGKGRYQHQKQFILVINEYVYVVPFVENEQKIFLKTIIPSRKLTKQYLLGGNDEEV